MLQLHTALFQTSGFSRFVAQVLSLPVPALASPLTGQGRVQQFPPPLKALTHWQAQRRSLEFKLEQNWLNVADFYHKFKNMEIFNACFDMSWDNLWPLESFYIQSKLQNTILAHFLESWRWVILQISQVMLWEEWKYFQITSHLPRDESEQ